MRHNELLWRLESVNDQLAALRVGQADIIALLKTETLRDIQQETDMAKKLAEIVADAKKNAEDNRLLIEQQATKLDGVKVFIQGQAATISALKTQLQEFIDAGGDPVQLSQLEAIVAAMQANEDSLTNNTDGILAAVEANTEDGGSPA